MGKGKKWGSFTITLDEASDAPYELADHPLTKPLVYKFDIVSIPPPPGGWEPGVWYRVVVSAERTRAERIQGEYGFVATGDEPLSAEEEKELYKTDALPNNTEIRFDENTRLRPRSAKEKLPPMNISMGQIKNVTIVRDEK